MKKEFAFFAVKIGYSDQLNKARNKSPSIIAILDFFAYAHRALLTVFR